MLVKIKSTETIKKETEVTKEIALPFHSKIGTDFKRVNRDGSLIKITQCRTFFSLSFTQTDGFYYDIELQHIVEAEECSEDEFLEAFSKCTQMVDKSIAKSEQLTPAI